MNNLQLVYNDFTGNYFRIRKEDNNAMIDISVTKNNRVLKWKPVVGMTDAIDIAIEFDGLWSMVDKKYYFTPNEFPWLFWVSSTNVLQAKFWEDYTTQIELATGVVKCCAIRGWKNVLEPYRDQGIICAYIKTDGRVYYRNYSEQLDGNMAWDDEVLITYSPLQTVNINVFRCNDYRVGFIFEDTSGNITWTLSKRCYTNMAIGDDYISTSLTDLMVDAKNITTWNTSNTETLSVGLSDLSIKFMYGLSPVPISAYNSDAFNIYLSFDYPIILNGDQRTYFTITDENSMSIAISDIVQLDDKTLQFICLDFNNAYNNMTITYSGGTMQSATPNIAVDNFAFTFTPTGLIPTRVPVMVTMYNIG